MDESCIFCRIAAGQLPSQKVYEDDDLVVFKDIHPAAPVHLLIVPREHIPTLSDVTAEHQPLLGKMMALAPRLAVEQGASNGMRTVVNSGPDGGQVVWHLHMHVLGGPRPWKTPG